MIFPHAIRYKAHIKTRNSVERAFSIWKRHFPCLDMRLQHKPCRAVQIITACAALHNLACLREDSQPPPPPAPPVVPRLAGQPPTALAGPLRTWAITLDLWPLGPDEGSMEQTQVPTRPPQGDSTLADPLQTGASPDLSPLSEGPDEVSVRDPWTQQHLQGMEQGTAITLTTNHLNNEKLSALQQRVLDQEADNKRLHAKVSIVSGISQGSILGPTLFLVCVNDMSQSDRLLVVQCADNTSVLCPVFDTRSCQHLQDYLEELSPNKSTVIRFSARKSVTPPEYTLMGASLVPCKSLSILGVMFTPTMDFSAHVACVVAKAQRMLGFVAQVTRPCEPASLHTLCTAMVLPSLEYCRSVWSPTQQHLIERIESVQRRASRTICSRTLGHVSGLVTRECTRRHAQLHSSAYYKGCLHPETDAHRGALFRGGMPASLPVSGWSHII
ncbi:hypothetical protein HPB47_014897 [Ixodes persulcatus]|uniref:Uncharacterized protein n=1 Tax=Ixodes persulcatus TaxID=34615 RepID=A0AC60QYE2_IXOPE|nr:hypothetical protein HPB47_014897 [Ixodes persulcatus]